MGSATIQGKLWGARPNDWATKAEPTTMPLWRAILSGCAVGQGTNHLDMGCGAGGLGVLSAELGASLTGHDASESLIEIARTRIPAGTFSVGDIENLPFPDGSFDVVTASNCIQFAETPVNAVREAKRVLKSGGRFGMGMWCEPERCELMMVMGGVMKLMPPPPDNAPPTLTIPENLSALLVAGGFEILEITEIECPFEFRNLEGALAAFTSAGIIVPAIEKLGEQTVRDAMSEGIARFTSADGSIRLVNWFRCAICA